MNSVDLWGLVIKPKDNATQEQREQLEQALAYLKGSETGKALIERLEKSDVEIEIWMFDSTKETLAFDVYMDTIDVVIWDPKLGSELEDGDMQTPSIRLAHELGHAAQDLDGITKDSSGEDFLENNNLSMYENPIASELQEGIRASYADCIDKYFDSPIPDLKGECNK